MSSSSSMRRFKDGRRSKNKRQPQQHLKLYDHAGLIPLIRTDESRTYTFVQNTADYTLQQTAITPNFLSFNFSLDQLAQYASFTTLFDQYKFDQVQVIIRPAVNAYGLTSSLSTQRIPMLYTVIDYDDNATPGSLAVLQEYSNCAISQYETTVATFQPHIALAAYDGSVFTSFANQTNQWIDAAYPSVKHYGIKMGCDPGISGQTNLQSWNIAVRYRISFRNVR